jgi:hypothetical protein
MANDKNRDAKGASTDTIINSETGDPKPGDLAAAQARIAALEAELAAAKAAPAAVGAQGGPLRAKHGLAIMVGGERLDIAAGETFEAPAESLAGLKLGEHFEQASK